jgi:hypothetical protein
MHGYMDGSVDGWVGEWVDGPMAELSKEGIVAMCGPTCSGGRSTTPRPPEPQCHDGKVNVSLLLISLSLSLSFFLSVSVSLSLSLSLYAFSLSLSFIRWSDHVRHIKNGVNSCWRRGLGLEGVSKGAIVIKDERERGYRGIGTISRPQHT